jgi:carbamate kinase
VILLKILVALGGNALLKSYERGTFEEQSHWTKIACRQLVEMVKEHELIVTHGNGPQIGKLHLQNELANTQTPALPLDVCGAMTQGQIGYMIQQFLKRELLAQGLSKEVVSIITQVVVDPKDPRMDDPTKPIGSFYTKEEAQMFIKEKNETWIEDSGRGWRKVVPSPVPIKIVEEKAIRQLTESGYIVVAAGGGGIPVIDTVHGYKGIEAVIDKDLAGGLLAELVDADVFIMLTDVAQVSLNYGKPNQQNLGRVTVSEMERYEKEGHFASGSMGPKVRIATQFASKQGKRAIITSLEEAVSALNGNAGTVITAERCYSVI